MNGDPEEAARADAVGLSAGDVDALATTAQEPLNEFRIGTERFLRLEDVLPPCPPRGMFDVERIRDSAYFFS